MIRLADLPTPTPATLLRIQRLLRQCEPPPRSDRAAGLGRADGTRGQLGEGETYADWLGICADLDEPE